MLKFQLINDRYRYNVDGKSTGKRDQKSYKLIFPTLVLTTSIPYWAQLRGNYNKSSFTEINGSKK